MIGEASGATLPVYLMGKQAGSPQVGTMGQRLIGCG